MNKFVFPLSLLLAAVAAPAFATEHAHEGMDMCPMHDKSMTDAERTAAMGKMFDTLDANHDGSISREEFDRHHADMRAKHEHHGQAADAGDKHEHGEAAQAAEKPEHQH